jgi:hypothetical protein
LIGRGDQIEIIEDESESEGSGGDAAPTYVHFRRVVYRGNELAFSGPPYFVDVSLDLSHCAQNSVFDLAVHFSYASSGSFVSGEVRAGKGSGYEVLQKNWATASSSGGSVLIVLKVADVDARKLTLIISVVARIDGIDREDSATVRVRCG